MDYIGSSKDKAVEAKNSVQNLARTIHSLLGFKAHLTSKWVSSVCDIVKSLPAGKAPIDPEPKLETRNSQEIKDVELASSVKTAEEELASLQSHINLLNRRRRQVLNDYLDLKGNIRVFCRIRPITVDKNSGLYSPIVPLDSRNVYLEVAGKRSKSYTFDKVFQPHSSQDEIFSEVEPIIKSALDGYNACIFAYGQTGAGKTFTMEGTPDLPGVVPQTMEALFKEASNSNHAFLFNFSMLEIYLGHLKDLLVPQPMKPIETVPPRLSVQTDPKGGIDIENLVAIQVNNFNHALRLYNLGCRFRSTASTNCNTSSSRSHCLIRMSITCFDAPERQCQTNKIWLVDLGGSERVLKTKAQGRRLEEGKSINLSLTALGDVINALQRRKRHIPFRNSKLTQVLKDSLGEDSKTVMLVHISPREEHLCETICTLNFAARVRSIRLENEDPTARKHREFAMENLQQIMEKIENERHSVRRKIEKLTRETENLKKPTTFVEDDSFITEVPRLNTEVKDKDKEIARASLLLPRFMRPTICSQRKFAVENQTFKEKYLTSTRRRKPSPPAASLTLPGKSNSDYKSEASVSRASCLVALTMIQDEDYETQNSEDMAGSNVKMVAFQEKKKPPCIPTYVESNQNQKEKSINMMSTKYDIVELEKVDDCSHPPDGNITVTSTGGKVPLISLLKKQPMSMGKSATNRLQHEKMIRAQFTMDRVASQHREEEKVDIEKLESSTTEAEVLMPRTPLKGDHFVGKGTRNSPTPSIPDAADSEVIGCTQYSVNASKTIEDNEFGGHHPSDICCCQLDKLMENRRGNPTNNMPNIENSLWCHNATLWNNIACTHFSSSTLEGIVCPKVSIFYRPHQSVSSEMSKEDNRQLDIENLSRKLDARTRMDEIKMRPKCTLSFNKETEESMKMIRGQRNTYSSGLIHVIHGKIRVLLISILLGLGLQSHGFDHDFFFGLML